jgi:hypothetical protein
MQDVFACRARIPYRESSWRNSFDALMATIDSDRDFDPFVERLGLISAMAPG